MTIDEARRLVLEAGIKLVKSGLIARTWGNISCRIDNEYFAITPSGRDYLSLSADEIVTVKISDCSYIGDIKPSSEKGIHSEIYKLHAETNFVIHTHQENASIVSTLGLDFIAINSHTTYLSNKVICAAYGLPGTKKLRRNVVNAALQSCGKSIIMKNHGAISFGKTPDEAFDAAFELEKACKDFIINKYLMMNNCTVFDDDEMRNYSLSKFTNNAKETVHSIYRDILASKRTENGIFLIHSNGKESKIAEEKNTSLSDEAFICNAIFKKYKDINYITFNHSSDVSTIVDSGIELKPLLDDFAQLAGTAAKNVALNASQICLALKNSSIVFVKGYGAVCCGKSEEDAAAVSIVTEKACKAAIASSLFGEMMPINKLECKLMRFVYLKKYSKQAHM